MLYDTCNRTALWLQGILGTRVLPEEQCRHTERRVSHVCQLDSWWVGRREGTRARQKRTSCHRPGRTTRWRKVEKVVFVTWGNSESP